MKLAIWLRSSMTHDTDNATRLAAYRRARRAHVDLRRRLMQLDPQQPGREFVEEARWTTLNQALAARAALFGHPIAATPRRLDGDAGGIERFARQLAARALDARRKIIH